VGRIEEESVVKRVYMSKVDCSRGRGIPKLTWMDRVKAAVERRGANIEYARMCVQDSERWTREVHSKHMYVGCLYTTDFGVSCVWTAILMIDSHFGTLKSECNRCRQPM
jgi:hypothetical protein